MNVLKSAIIFASIVSIAACTASTQTDDPNQQLANLWIKHSAEYQAVALQAYHSATRDLPKFLQDKSWNALRGRGEPSSLPPAVILDVDETVVSNVDFQFGYERPFTNRKMDDWNNSHTALAVPGVVSFVDAAREMGITVFFVTNRPCEPVAGIEEPCPQKTTTIKDIEEAGIHVNPQYLMLANERPEWDREKQVRREFIAASYRVIMLVGDDLSDFIPCVRKKPTTVCPDPASSESRRDALRMSRDFWGNGWYILPNPMHGSWTSFD